MAYINFQPSDYFNTLLYTGNNSSSNAITGVGFQPDWVWLKARNYGDSHRIYDAVRGANNHIASNSSGAQASLYNLSFASDGFTIGSSDPSVNGNYNYVSWNWKAGGAGSSNTDGSVTSTVSANTSAGFSIVKFDPTGAACTIGHGLGVAPKVIITKALNRSFSWVWGGDAIGWTKYLELNNTQESYSSSARWNDTAPTSTVFSVKNEFNSGDNAIAYCFAEKTGFSKFGSYTGNGNANGAFIYTGFKPAFVLWKRYNSTGAWYQADNKRDTFNPVDTILGANDSATESGFGSANDIDYLSNGFKLRTTTADWNASGGNYIYMAFAEEPLVSSNNIPATAR